MHSIRLSSRRKEIIDDLIYFGAISEETARKVYGCDYTLSLQMAIDNQLGKVPISYEPLGKPPNNITNEPDYMFYVLIGENT